LETAGTALRKAVYVRAEARVILNPEIQIRETLSTYPFAASKSLTRVITANASAT